MRLPESSYVGNGLSLVLGVDGSGKTSFMNGVSKVTGATVLEPTGSQKAKDFKRFTFDKPITPELVDAREVLFTELNRDFDESIEEALGRTDILTSGSLLVTRLSHFAMRGVICSPQAISATGIVDEWLTSAKPTPDKIVYLHAPSNIIRERLLGREMAGDIGERPFGYNSPLFLDKYNKVLGAAVSYLYGINPDGVSTYDTSLESTTEIVDDFLSS